MTNPKLKLFYIAQSLAFTYFWIAIAVPYLLYRGLSSIQVFSLMAIYQFLGVFLEYPTGVIGDRYGYRRVTYLSNTLNFIATLLLALHGGYYFYLSALALLALGNGFSSGNDMGILKAVSTNIKKDIGNYNSLIDFLGFLSAVIGGLIAKFSFELALVISGVCMFAANIPLFLLRDGIGQIKSTHSVKSVIKDSVSSLKNSTFRQLFVTMALFGGFSYTTKNIFGSFGNIFHIDITMIGLIVGLAGLARSIGGKCYAEVPKKNIAIPAILFSCALIALSMFPNYLIVASLLIFSQLIVGYIGSKMDGDMHALASDHTRASLFSLKRLMMRIVAASYLIIYGMAIGVGQFSLLMFGTGITLLLSTVFVWQYLSGHSEKSYTYSSKYDKV